MEIKQKFSFILENREKNSLNHNIKNIVHQYSIHLRLWTFEFENPFIFSFIFRIQAFKFKSIRS